MNSTIAIKKSTVNEKITIAQEKFTNNSGQNYRYLHFNLGLMMEDFQFSISGPKAGDKMPDFDLVDTAGNQIKKNNYLGNKPLLLVFGSSTCPMTASSFQPLMNLFQEFGDQIGFIMLNVREAHPGEHFPQPQTFEQKHANASKMKERYQIPWAVAVDDIDGSFHRALDPKPNAAYIMNVEGNIVFRSLWAGDESALRTALEQVANGQEPSKKQSVAMFGPLSRGIGYFLEVLKLHFNSKNQVKQHNCPGRKNFICKSLVEVMKMK